MEATTIKPNPITLRFARRLEREYQQHYSERNVGYARAAFASGILMFASFAHLDYVLSPAHYQAMWMIRLGLATPLFLLMLLFMFTRWFALLMQPSLAIACVLVAASVDWINVIAFEDTGKAYFFGVIIVNLYLHTFGRVQWAWAAPAGILNIIVYQLSLLLVEDVSSEVFFASNYFIISTLTLGMVANYTIDHMSRREFLNFRHLSHTNAELHAHSRTDPLTGLLNRRSMLERLDEEAARTKRVPRTFSVAILDADHFKQVNDKWGHDCGDKVLKTLAELMQESLRTDDVVARWGGEEFLVLFPDTRLAAARIFAEQLRRRVRSRAFTYNNVTIPVTVTIGLAEVASGESLAMAIKRADEALYEGKRLGRDRTIAAVPMHPAVAGNQ